MPEALHDDGKSLTVRMANVKDMVHHVLYREVFVGSTRMSGHGSIGTLPVINVWCSEVRRISVNCDRGPVTEMPECTDGCGNMLDGEALAPNWLGAEYVVEVMESEGVTLPFYFM
jgi:hypothetical protein